MITIYIQITIDLKNYNGETLDLRLSNYYTIKKLIDIVWQERSISMPPREGYWVRVLNKNTVYPGSNTLEDSEIMTGDKLEIL